MFSIVDAAGLRPHELSFVGPVLFDRSAIFARHDCGRQDFHGRCQPAP
jgi:hypothetical protein